MTQKFLERRTCSDVFMSETQNLNQVHAFSIWRETKDNTLNNRKDNRLECNTGLRLQALLWVYIKLEMSPKNWKKRELEFHESKLYKI